ncbi:hypothetical protein CEP88_19970 [Roseobacter denitrificans]|uniref:HEPN AbiU2-like domain-containing protein n=1 Tax=Roseobacter denitrificans (strain ATCC 33942 / OCh 114) TaxID=375451 RepID=Q168D5_ROSDO|nr:hypothetical protein [Roseobacter denitrificans]ABG31658.1 hypothetical protein RD1_2056 [Roseobacter denitrificans OCh 114]AVL54635.1 hypothetical protein CEP88_19970 [Roseobacter denitrificans]SFF88705.1 hypothetical protein SAMN05443635_103172 [Roseobacter denitrificans OCh 114]
MKPEKLEDPELCRRVKRLDKVVGQLEKRFSSALYDIGSLKGTVDNPNVGKKLGHSYSGHFLDTSIRALSAKVALFVTKSFDKNSHSVTSFLREVDGMAPYIEHVRKSKHPDWSDEWLEVGGVAKTIRELSERVDLLQSSEQFLALKINRDEMLAHSLEGESGQRRKLNKIDIDPSPITYRQLLDMSVETAEIISEAIRIWTFSVIDPKDWIENAEEYAVMFWHSIPSLTEVEEMPDKKE